MLVPTRRVRAVEDGEDYAVYVADSDDTAENLVNRLHFPVDVPWILNHEGRILLSGRMSPNTPLSDCKCDTQAARQARRWTDMARPALTAVHAVPLNSLTRHGSMPSRPNPLIEHLGYDGGGSRETRLTLRRGSISGTRKDGGSTWRCGRECV